MTLVERSGYIKRVRWLLKQSPVVALLGARQVGKTTLAQQFIKKRRGPCTFFDLEDPRDRAQLEEPTLTLSSMRGLIVLDEIQRVPDLFEVLRVLADRPRTPARFLVLGSASPELLKQSSETLAGRIAFQEISGFDLEEVGPDKLERLWLRGCFPRSFLTRTHTSSEKWRTDFIRTFLQRDLPQLGVTIPSMTLERFWTMLAHYHGQTWNASEIARALAVSHVTVRKYLDLLSNAFVVSQLRPWSVNIGKRVVRSPKVYIADSGILHSLLGVTTRHDLLRHPKLGASWEGFMLHQVIRHLRVEPEECYFWSTYAGADLDLLIVRGTKRIGYEFKRTDTPKVTRSMMEAMTSLDLDHIDVIHAGSKAFQLRDRIRAIPAAKILSDLHLH